MNKIFSLLVAFSFFVNVFSNPADSLLKSKLYRINYPVVGVTIAVGMVSDFFAIGRIKGKTAITSEELSFLNSTEQRNHINSFDRWALNLKASDRKRYQHFSDYGEAPFMLLPGLLVLDKNIRKKWADLLLIYTEGHVVTFTFYNYSFLGPTFQNRYRPVTYYSEFTDDERKNGNNRNSFYSGHVASCAYSTFFMAKVYCDYHPGIGMARYFLYIAAAVPPLLMGYVRTKSLDHFPSDDAIGLVLGSALGIVIPQLHKYPCSNFISMGMFTSPGGLGISLKVDLDHSILASGLPSKPILKFKR
ncbi:MAG: phosphatase PAP2 family protein [Bacteroidetes bacterium]|nr:phosphatase PAP2 family protein [Bacteroidota bacterium]